MPIFGIYALNWLCISIYLAFGGSMQSHWRLHAESLAAPCGVIRRLHAESLAAPCGVIRRLHAESFGSMRSHLPAQCGVIRRLDAESFAGSMRSHSPAPCGVICRLHAESFAGSMRSHLLAQLIRLLQAEPSSWLKQRAIIPVARIGTPSLMQNSVALL